MIFEDIQLDVDENAELDAIKLLKNIGRNGKNGMEYRHEQL